MSVEQVREVSNKFGVGLNEASRLVSQTTLYNQMLHSINSASNVEELKPVLIQLLDFAFIGKKLPR